MRLRKLVPAISICLLIFGGISPASALTYQPDDKALTLLEEPPAGVEIIKQRQYIMVVPEGGAENGIIFYPGAYIEPAANIPLAVELAEQGYAAALPKMPFGLAILGRNKANWVIRGQQGITTWIIGGHSLGGVSASEYARKNQDKVQGLILLASYPSREIHSLRIPVTSLYGELDGVLPVEDALKRKHLFPSTAKFLLIPGANHSQFGSYGIQRGDFKATISAVEQQRIVVKEIVSLLQ